jgi:uncharacterized protein (DUF58 family)
MRLPGPLARLRDSWLARRLGRQGDAVHLDYRRIFILPTRAGLGFAALLVVLWLGAVNYSNNLAYLLVFLLAGTGNAMLLHTFRNLAGLTVARAGVDPVFAGGVARFRVRLADDNGRRRMGLVLARADSETGARDVAPGSGEELALEVEAPGRGVLRPGRFAVATRFPGGLFRAWSWLQPQWTCVVYPRPEGGRVPDPPPAAGEEGGGGRSGSGHDDFDGLRRYQAGDPPRHVAWRLVARGQEPQTKVFAGQAPSRLWLDWDTLGDMAPEARLSRLCRWVLDAEHRGQVYGLRLPGVTIPPERGPDHRHRCLDALARFRP